MSVNSFYVTVASALNDRFGLDWSETQMKNKWDNLKRSFVHWNSLLQIPGGTWDPVNDRLDGSNEWWNSGPVSRFRRFRRNPPIHFRMQNTLFGGCIGTSACLYPIPPTPPAPAPEPAPAQSFTAADTEYYSDWVTGDHPPAATPATRRRRTELGSSSRSTVQSPRFREALSRVQSIVSAVTHVERWEIMQIFRNDPINLEIVEELTDEEILGFISSELGNLSHRRRG